MKKHKYLKNIYIIKNYLCIIYINNILIYCKYLLIFKIV